MAAQESAGTKSTQILYFLETKIYKKIIGTKINFDQFYRIKNMIIIYLRYHMNINLSKYHTKNNFKARVVLSILVNYIVLCK